MTKLYHFLAALFAGTLIYVFVSLACGRDGIWANTQLREQKEILTTRAQEIQKITNSLELEYNALERDPDVIAAFARKLGFVRSGEKIVKISGRDSSNQFIFDTGTPIESEIPLSIPEWICKVSGILMGLLVFLYLFWSDARERKNLEILYEEEKKSEKSGGENKSVLKEIPVYDLPQI